MWCLADRDPGHALSTSVYDVLPVFAPRGALEAVLALDPVRCVARAAQVERLVAEILSGDQVGGD